MLDTIPAPPSAAAPDAPPTEGWRGLETFRPMLRRWLDRRCRDANLADDVEQETLMRAARFERPPGEGRQRRWLLRVASNVLVDQVRRGRRAGHVTLEPEQSEALWSRESISVREDGDEDYRVGRYLLDRDLARRRVAGALERLAAADRQLIRTWFESGDTRTTAARCGLAPRLVKTRLFRARRRLQRALRMEVACRWQP